MLLAGWPALPTFAPGESPVLSSKFNQYGTALDYEQNKPTFVVKRSASNFASGNTGTWAFINWDNADKNTEVNWTVSPNPQRLVAKTAGWYLITLEVSWGSNTAGSRIACMTLNQSTASGTNVIGGHTSTAAALNAGGREYQDCTGLVSMNVNDWVTAELYQDSGTNAIGGQALLLGSSYARMYGFLVSKL